MLEGIFENTGNFFRYNIAQYGLYQTTIILGIIVVLLFLFHYLNYQQSSRGGGFHLFEEHKTNLKFPIWSSVVLYFGTLIYVFIQGSKMNSFLLGPWAPISAVANFFIQYIIAVLFHRLDITSLRKLTGTTIVAVTIILIIFSGYYSIYKFGKQDISNWSEEAAVSGRPEICRMTVGWFKDDTAGKRQSECLKHASYLSGEKIFCDAILENKQNKICSNDLQMAINLSSELCRVDGKYDAKCVDSYCDLDEHVHPHEDLSFAQCFYKKAHEEDSETWCKRIIGNDEMKNKCLNTNYFFRASKKLERSYCEKMNGRTEFGDDKNACFDIVKRNTNTSLALTEKDASYCNKIELSDDQEFCNSKFGEMRQAREYYNKAVERREDKWCEYIKPFITSSAGWHEKWDFDLNNCYIHAKLK